MLHRILYMGCQVPMWFNGWWAYSFWLEEMRQRDVTRDSEPGILLLLLDSSQFIPTGVYKQKMLLETWDRQGNSSCLFRGITLYAAFEEGRWFVHFRSLVFRAVSFLIVNLNPSQSSFEIKQVKHVTVFRIFASFFPLSREKNHLTYL